MEPSPAKDQTAPSYLPPPAPGRPTHQEELGAAMTKVLGESLQPASVGLLIIYLLLAPTYAMLLPAGIGHVIAAAAGVTSIAMLVLLAVLKDKKTPVSWTHPVGVVMAALVLLNSLLPLYLTGKPLFSIPLVLLVLGAGYLFISTGWLVLVLAAALVGFGIGVWLSPESPGWIYYGFALLTGTLLSIIIHAWRVKTLQLDALRVQYAHRKTEFETVLISTEEAQRSLATSMAVGQRITSILDLDKLLDEVANLIQARFNCDYVGIYLLDESGEYVVSRAGTGEVGRELCKQGYRLKVGTQGIIGWVAARRRPARVDDVLLDTRYIGVDLLPNIRSKLALPLEMGTNVLGVIDMESEKPAAFKEDDVPFLQLLADQIAIAIQNASLYQTEKSHRRLAETLYHIGRVLSSTLNPTEVFDLILEHLAEIVPYDRASVMLRSGEELEFAAAHGFPPGYQNLHVSIKENDVFSDIYRTKQPLSIPDVLERADWQQVENLPQARAWLGIPLIHSDEVLGMLSLTREVPNAYRKDEVTLAATFAGQAAIALHNARLYDQITRFNQNLENVVQQRTEELQKAYNQLERLDMTKSKFINIASHELRTPLTLIYGYTQILLSESDILNNTYYQQLISGINTGAGRLAEIINSLLDVAKIDSQELHLHPTPITIPSLVRFVYEKLRKPLEERHLTFTEDYQELPAIEADLDALRKVFENLIINAIKYTPDGGHITVSGRALAPGEMNLPEGGVEVVVSDTGIGIDPSLRDLIFTKFYQTGEITLHSTGKTKYKGGGPGLGLTIVKGIVAAHGGVIWVESPGYSEEIYPGSNFHVVLPCSPTKAF